jgi:hypothetical protein
MKPPRRFYLAARVSLTLRKASQYPKIPKPVTTPRLTRAAPALLGDFFAQQFEEKTGIVVISENIGTRIGARGQVIQRAGKFQTQRTGHALSLRRNKCEVKN